jgi:hypothetical protein
VLEIVFAAPLGAWIKTPGAGTANMHHDHDIDRAVRDCVRYCSRRKKWFLYVIAYVHRLVRRHLLDELEAAEVTYRARKLIRGHQNTSH